MTCMRMEATIPFNFLLHIKYTPTIPNDSPLQSKIGLHILAPHDAVESTAKKHRFFTAESIANSASGARKLQQEKHTV